eukprot:COSAG01_NODE_2506_length_7552_cov_66.389776_3_plen_180_part_00
MPKALRARRANRRTSTPPWGCASGGRTSARARCASRRGGASQFWPWGAAARLRLVGESTHLRCRRGRAVCAQVEHLLIEDWTAVRRPLRPAACCVDWDVPTRRVFWSRSIEGAADAGRTLWRCGCGTACRCPSMWAPLPAWMGGACASSTARRCTGTTDDEMSRKAGESQSLLRFLTMK